MDVSTGGFASPGASGLNGLGTVYDTKLDKPYRDGGRRDDAWTLDGMKLAVHVDGTINDDRDRDRGWTAELAIPWTALCVRDASKRSAARA